MFADDRPTSTSWGPCDLNLTNERNQTIWQLSNGVLLACRVGEPKLMTRCASRVTVVLAEVHNSRACPIKKEPS